jgi:HEPN domain-containing protein
MHEAREIARAFFIESEVDYRIAQLLSGTEYHSRTIYFIQQAVEKIVKACLSLKNIRTVDHNLSALFAAVYQEDFRNMDDLVRGIDSLERHGARVRFPLFQRPDLPIWIPSRSYTDGDAGRAMRTGDVVYQSLKAYLDQALTEPGTGGSPPPPPADRLPGR